jgi:hypothetical protein
VRIFTFEIGLFVAVGILGMWMATGWLSLLQASAPDAYRGRVFGVLGAVFALLNVAGIIAASTLTDRIGVVTMLNIQGSGYIVAGVLLLALLPHQRRNLAMPEPASSTTAVLMSDPLVR